MIKTQIQLPDGLYHDLKRLAAAREWSLAEVLRRGGEYMVSVYPVESASGGGWHLPEPLDVGWMGLSDEAILEEAQLTSVEERMPRERGAR